LKIDKKQMMLILLKLKNILSIRGDHKLKDYAHSTANNLMII